MGPRERVGSACGEASEGGARGGGEAQVSRPLGAGALVDPALELAGGSSIAADELRATLEPLPAAARTRRRPAHVRRCVAGPSCRSRGQGRTSTTQRVKPGQFARLCACSRSAPSPCPARDAEAISPSPSSDSEGSIGLSRPHHKTALHAPPSLYSFLSGGGKSSSSPPSPTRYCGRMASLSPRGHLFLAVSSARGVGPGLRKGGGGGEGGKESETHT